jgi:cold-inducible RNA-binding protein
MGTRLFVGNLSYNVNEQELKETFTTEGIEVRSVRVALDRETGRPRGFAFVETMTDDGAKLSIEKLSGHMLQGRPLIVEEAQARPGPGAPRPGGPGGPPRPFGPPRPGGPSGPPGAPGAGGFGGPPRPFAPRPPGAGGPGSFGPPRPGVPAAPNKFGAPAPPRGGDGRRDRPEKKKSTRPKPEERERGNWRWKGTLDED